MTWGPPNEFTLSYLVLSFCLVFSPVFRPFPRRLKNSTPICDDGASEGVSEEGSSISQCWEIRFQILQNQLSGRKNFCLIKRLLYHRFYIYWVTKVRNTPSTRRRSRSCASELYRRCESHGCLLYPWGVGVRGTQAGRPNFWGNFERLLLGWLKNVFVNRKM